jgi:hypothetical protein
MSFLLLGVLLAADARPTAADVATAVQLSREKHSQKSSPLARNHAQAEADLKRRITIAERSLLNSRQITETTARLAAAKSAADEIGRLRGELSEVRRQKSADAAHQNLDEIDLSALTVGLVGQLRSGRDSSGFTVTCDRVLGPDKSIVKIIRYGMVATTIACAAPGTTVIERRSVPRIFATVILKGAPTLAMREGVEIRDLALNVVVVGRERRGKPLPVLEAFDPDRPFK